jgi:hypothetical protein
MPPPRSRHQMVVVPRFSLLALLLLTGCGDAPTWSEAYDATDSGWLMNTFAVSTEEIYAVGGDFDDGRVFRTADGTATWSEVALGLDAPLLNWGIAFGPRDVTVVGNEGVALHFDGDGWTTQTTPTEEDLWGVWGASPDDLWAVGGRGREGSEATILRYDGIEWTAVEVPELERPRVFAFFKVWGSGPDDVFIVGQRGAVLRWDGATLTEELVGATDDLIAVWGTGPDNVVAVGGRGNGVVSHFDGVDWRSAQLAPTLGLNGVWMRRPGVAHVVGERGTLATLDVETLEILEEDVEELRFETRDFHAITGVGDRVVAVGGDLATPMPPQQGIAWTRSLETDE